jgi:hypothetical protein
VPSTALLAAVCLALAVSGCGDFGSEDSDATRSDTAAATSTETGATATSAPTATEAGETSGEAEGVLPEPRFVTPGKAAYCADQETSQEELGPTLFCWTPRDGFGVGIAWNAERATADVYDEPPRVVHGVGVLKGYAPTAETLPFARRWVYRCTDTDEIATCAPQGDGRVAFTCVSEEARLTCTNAVGHGFTVFRSGGFRLF